MRLPLVRAEVAPIPVPLQPLASSPSGPAEEKDEKRVLRQPVPPLAMVWAAVERARELLVVPSSRFVPQASPRAQVVQKVPEPPVQPQAPPRAQATPRAQALLPELAQLTRSSMQLMGCYDSRGAQLENRRRRPTHPTRPRPGR